MDFSDSAHYFPIGLSSSDSGCDSSFDNAYAENAYATKMSSMEEEPMDCSENEFIIVDDDVTQTQFVTDPVAVNDSEVDTENNLIGQTEVQAEPTNMDVSTDETEQAEPERHFDITGHQASRVIVSNLGAMSHHCDLCGADVPDLNAHFGDCPAELDLGPDVDQLFDAGQFLEHLRALEPEPEAPPIATRYIPGDHINNMEFLLNCMAKERLRNV